MKDLRLPHSFAAMLFALAGLSACSKQPAAATSPEVVPGIAVIRVAARTLPDMVDVTGTVRAAESATLSAQVMGTITGVAVREGDHVRARQTLVTIDAAQMSAQVQRASASAAAMEQQVAAAESDSALAAGTLKRYQMLQAQRAVSPQEFDEVESRAKAASARLAAARSQRAEALAATAAARTTFGYFRIRAPFDGVVTERRVDPGAMAAPGTPLLTLEKSGPLRLEIAVDESLLSAVRAGAPIPVVLDTLGRSPLQGKVARLVPTADPGSRSFLVKIDLPQVPAVYSGMFGHALLARGSTRQAAMIPSAAIVSRGSMQNVYVVGPDHIAAVRYIAGGKPEAGEVEVLSGLAAGEFVVASPDGRELSGRRIEAGP